VKRALGCLLLAGALAAFAQEKPPAPTAAFRTDGGDEKLPWHEIKPGEFPPEGSSHYIAGELIGLDHINRTGTLRPDRRTDQRTDDYDRPLPFTLLPYASMRYHGAPAELRDLPIGTHLHGAWYFEAKAGKDKKGAFTQIFRLEDDFSFHERQQRTWRVDAVQLDKGTLTVTGQTGAENKPDEKSLIYKITPATRVWKGTGFGKLEDLAPGQAVLINITVATLKGPGRCTDIWLDPESRKLATAHQLEVHRLHQKSRGIPGWVNAVDDAQNTVTVTLFGGSDPKLLEEMKKGSGVHTAVAEASLRSYDQSSDALTATVSEVNAVPLVPGSSGVQLVFKPEIMLEGFRPGRFLRLISQSWRIDDLPYEERLYK